VIGIFIDTNVFYNILFKTRLTESLLEKFEEEPFYTSQVAINELLYIAVAIRTDYRFGSSFIIT